MFASFVPFFVRSWRTETSATAKLDVKLARSKIKKTAKCGNKLGREPCGTE